jgi:hypothetical protein
MKMPAATLGLIAAGVIVAFAAQQPSTTEWRVGASVTDNDKASIVELARQMGIERPRTVLRVGTAPAGCEVLTIASDERVDGNRVSWAALDIHRSDSRNCWRPVQTRRVGRWFANTPTTRTETRWRVRDAAWHVDVPIEQGVPYQDVERIVLAIRQAALVNTLPDGAPMPPADADALTSIKKTAGKADGHYTVTVGRGPRGGLLFVALVDGRVELHGHRALDEI